MVGKYVGSKVPERKTQSIKIIPNRVTTLLQVRKLIIFITFEIS